MKKKIYAIVLCIFVLCSLCITFIACDETPGDKSPEIVGTWIGYNPRNSATQYYFDIEYSKKSGITSVMTVRETVNFKSEIKETTYNGTVTHFANKNYSLVDEYFNNDSYAANPAITLSEDGKEMTVKNVLGLEFKFKRTELSLSQWQMESFKVIPNENNDIIYKALYFEGEDRRIFNIDDILERFSGIQEGGYIRYNNREMYYLYLTRGNNQQNVFNIQAIKLRAGFPNTSIEVSACVYYDYRIDKICTSSDLKFGEDTEWIKADYLSGNIVVNDDMSFTIEIGVGSNMRSIIFKKTNKSLQEVKDLANSYDGWKDWE